MDVDSAAIWVPTVRRKRRRSTQQTLTQQLASAQPETTSNIDETPNGASSTVDVQPVDGNPDSNVLGLNLLESDSEDEDFNAEEAEDEEEEEDEDDGEGSEDLGGDEYEDSLVDELADIDLVDGMSSIQLSLCILALSTRSLQPLIVLSPPSSVMY